MCDMQFNKLLTWVYLVQFPVCCVMCVGVCVWCVYGVCACVCGTCNSTNCLPGCIWHSVQSPVCMCVCVGVCV